MKKIFLNRRNALLTPTTLSVGALVLIFAFTAVGVRVLFPGAFVALAAPALSVGNALSALTSDMRAVFADAATLRRERDALREENATLMNENLGLKARLEDLTRLMGGASGETPGIIASVLARPPESPYDTLLVSAGSTSGISAGMRAVAPGGVPLGDVESVTASSARISLYSSSGRIMSAWVGERHVAVTLTGAGGGAWSATAPKDSGIVEGDIVYLAEGGALPLGRLARIDTDPSSPSATLYIAPLANLFSLVWVKLVP